jgi:HEAT repeats
MRYHALIPRAVVQFTLWTGGDTMLPQSLIRLLLVMLLAGLTGFAPGHALESSREPPLPSSPESLALSGLAVRQLPVAQPSPDPPRDTPPPEHRQSPSLLTSTIPASTGRPKTLIAVAENRLSVQVQNRSLAWILQEISHQSGVPILLSQGIRDRPVSIQLQDLPLDQGLQVLLKTLDAFLLYGAQEQSPAALRAVWVYPKGQGRRLVPAPSEAYAGAAEIQQNLSDPDPAERARTAELLIKRQRMRALDVVLQVLQDPDEQVRYRALYRAVHLDVALPTDLMQHLVLSDPSSVVRFLALEAVAKAPGADPARIRETAELALNDPSEAVQEQAGVILTALESAHPPAESSDFSQEHGVDRSD